MESEKETCLRIGTDFVCAQPDQKLGIALDTIGLLPINGMRIEPENGTCGWYIWCGTECSTDLDFYQPLHVAHIDQYLPQVKPYLGLPPGYRFMIADEYEDVWLDQSLRKQ